MKLPLYRKLKTSFAICITVFLLLLTFESCKKYITVETPSTNIGTEAAFKSNTSASQFLTGIISGIAVSTESGSLVSSCILAELSADNLKLHDLDESRNYIDYYRNSLDPDYSNSNQESTFWMKLYKTLFSINTAVENLTDNSYLTPTVNKRLLGEAYFLRAFCYFYLINFYGEVPLVLTTSYRDNAFLKKNTSTEVYAQILKDLANAETLLDFEYMNGDISGTTSNRLRPNLAAVHALQARVYLYLKEYSLAEIAATKVINQPGYGLTAVDEVFLKNSSETIWGLQPVEVGFNTRLAAIFLINPDSGPNSWEYPVYASNSLLNSFLPGDRRKSSWLKFGDTGGRDYYFISKYRRGYIEDSKSIDEYTIALRVAELYLIRAESRNEQGNTVGSVEDINSIRHRSRISDGSVANPLPALATTISQTQLRPLILNERRVELFTEWGHRWFDLRRSDTIDDVMTEENNVKGGSWAPYKVFYPIPRDEISVNRAIVQTPGY